MRIAIVCRGSTVEGLGHLFRTRTFAKRAAEAHAVRVVAVLEPGLEGVLAELPCPVTAVADDREAAAPVKAFRPDVLLYDTTWVSPAAFSALSGLAAVTASLSPVFDHGSQVDAVFSRTAGEHARGRAAVYGGIEYAIFNDRCAAIDDETYERSVSAPDLPIAVCMGGADAANKTLKVLSALMDWDAPSVLWVLLGEGYSHSYDALVGSVARGRGREVIFAKTSRSTWKIMGQCALAVVAGGLTTVEAVYAGLPTINLFERREHLEAAEDLFRLDACVDGGLFSEASLSTLRERLAAFHADRGLLRAMRGRCKGLVDGRGSERVLDVLGRLLRERA